MRSARLTVSVILCVSVLVGSARAQSASGSILGRVTDQLGAAVPDTKITVTNVATQVTNQTQTDAEGNYRVLNLPIGLYTVTGEHEGFARLVTEGRTLQINQQERMDLKLVVGARAETVEVNDVGSDVETVNPTLGDSVTSRPIVNLPLNGRNALDLALLEPGVTDHNPDDTGAGTFNIAGGRADSVTFLLDGGEDNNLLHNDVVFTPNPDAVAEFRILKSNYGAEYGRNAGGIVSLVTKSGTNQLHGSIFDFARNDAFNANDYFDIRAGNPREVLKRQQFGLTVGGPILLPKINGRDKFFWFFSYQGQRQTEKASQPGLNVFTPAELNGDFSQAGPGGIPDHGVGCYLVGFQPTGPFSDCTNPDGSPIQANPFFQPNPALAAQSIIDPTKINSIAQNYIKAGLIPTAPNGVLNAQAVATDNRNELTFKFDFNVSAKDRLSFTLGRNVNPILFPFPEPSSAPGFAVRVDNKQYFLNTAFTHTFNPNMLNEFRFTAQRATQLNAQPASPAKNMTAATLGVGITPDDPTGPPRLAFNQTGMVIGFYFQGPSTFANNTFSYLDTLSWVKGRHTLKLGFNFSNFQNNTKFDFFVNGEFDFDGSAGGIGTGHDLADFLLGLPDFYFQFPRAPSNIRTRDYYAFAQDEWRVTPRLVLTYGLRHEYGTPKLDTQGRSFSVIPGLQSTRFVNAPLGLVFPGDKGAPRGSNFPDTKNFAPRFGFAWDPRGDAKTSVRGGIGMFYDILKGEDNQQFNGQAPFFSSVSLSNFLPLNGSPPTVNYLAQPFTANGAVNPFPSKPPSPDLDFNAAGFIPFGGASVFFVDPHLRTPYSYQYNLSVQRELAKNLTLEMAYAGSSSHGLTALQDINPFALGTGNRILGPNFGFLDEFRNVVNANYNALQASLTKQLSNSKSFGNTYFTLAYTLAKSIDNASGFANRNNQVPSYLPALFRADSDFDVRNRIVFSGGWDLPFDNLWTSGPKSLTAGWSLYPIVSWRTGFPLDVPAGYPQNSFDPGPSGAGDANLVRANLAGSTVPILDPRKHPDPATGGNIYFPASAIPSIPADPSPVPTYGTLPRNFFRGPGRTNVDLAVAKITSLYGERVGLEFRVEFFNLFNHAQFANPNTTFGSPTFGEITSTTLGSGQTAIETQRIIQLGARIKF